MNENTLRWHVLSESTNESINKLCPGGGMRAGKGHFRTDIYRETDRLGYYVFYCHERLDGDGYSRAEHFDDVFGCMRWAQERYNEYLDPEQVEVDEDEYR